MSENISNLGRFVAIIEKLAGQSCTPTETKMQVFSRVFDADGDTYRVCEKLMKIHGLMELVKSDIVNSNSIRDISPFMNAFSMIERLVVPWGLMDAYQAAVTNYVTSDVRTVLGILKVVNVDKLESEIRIEESDLDILRKEMSEISKKIRDSDIDQELKKILLAGIERVRQAIEMYEIEGVEGIRAGMAYFLGNLFNEKEKIMRSAGAEKKDVLERLANFIAAVDSVIGKAKNVAMDVIALGKILGIS